jgi:glyoxylase-like metal-dependent hydrolase (beta-lactamase superfamily II)
MEIAAGVYSIGGRSGGYVRGFLLDVPGELTLIDTLYEPDARLVLAQLDRLGRSVRDLKHIVLSHAHRAHLGGLAALKRLSAARVYAHELEEEIVAGHRKARRVSLRPQRPLSLYLPVWFPWQLGLALGVGNNPNPCPVDETVGSEQQVGPLQIVNAPGHTPGHLAFYYPERRVLFVGDAIVTWPEFAPGWRRFTLDPVAQNRTLRRFTTFEPDVVAVGHGDPITRGATEHVHYLAEKEASDPTETDP